jgi:hypothetical protein
MALQARSPERHKNLFPAVEPALKQGLLRVGEDILYELSGQFAPQQAGHSKKYRAEKQNATWLRNRISCEQEPHRIGCVIRSFTHLVHIKAEFVRSKGNGLIERADILRPTADRLTRASGQLREDWSFQLFPIEVHSRRVISPNLEMKEGIARSNGLKYRKDHIRIGCTTERLELRIWSPSG